MRSRISIRGYVCLSVRPSVDPLVRQSHMSWIFKKWDFWAEIEQNSLRNMKHCYLKDDSETSTLADPQNASYVWTLSDLLLCFINAKFWPFYWLFWTRSVLIWFIFINPGKHLHTVKSHYYGYHGTNRLHYCQNKGLFKKKCIMI